MNSSSCIWACSLKPENFSVPSPWAIGVAIQNPLSAPHGKILRENLGTLGYYLASYVTPLPIGVSAAVVATAGTRRQTREGGMRRRRWRGQRIRAAEDKLWRRSRQRGALIASARGSIGDGVLHRVLAGTRGFTPLPRRRPLLANGGRRPAPAELLLGADRRLAPPPRIPRTSGSTCPTRQSNGAFSSRRAVCSRRIAAPSQLAAAPAAWTPGDAHRAPSRVNRGHSVNPCTVGQGCRPCGIRSRGGRRARRRAARPHHPLVERQLR